MNVPPAFSQWAPEESPWSDWVKPVLFASFTRAPLSADQRPPSVPETDVSGLLTAIPDARGDAFVIVDQPGMQAAAVGLALARRGYRPIALFNGVDGSPAVVPVDTLGSALLAWAEPLAALPLAPDAPPAFLLDSRRLSGEVKPGMFDNRWVVVPEDFPSANRLLHAGHRRCLLVLDQRDNEDLQHVLLRFHRAGIEISKAGAEGSLARHIPPRPRLFGSLFARAMVVMGLRRSSAGGFGAAVPVPSQGGYG